MIRKIRLRSVQALFLLLTAAVGRSQGWEVFDTGSAGFPSNNVSDIVEDHDGTIWVGTSFGLCEYDGAGWTIHQQGTSGLPDNVVKSLAVDSSGRLWVGTQLQGIGIYDGTAWDTLNVQNSPLPDNEILCITIDHRNWAWIGTYLGLVCYTGSDWFLYNDSDTSHAGLALNGNVVQDVAVRSDGLVAIGTLNGGFHYLTDTSVTVHATYIDNFPDNTQNGVIFDIANNERWLATPSQGLLRQGGDWQSGPWFQYTTSNSTIPSNAVTCLAEDGYSHVWFGTLLAGVGVRDPDGSFVNYTTSNSDLPDNTIASIVLASDGSIWVGTGYGGAARLTLPASMVEEGTVQLEVFPNPCADRLMIHTSRGDGTWTWSVLDTGGRPVRRGQASGGRQELDLSGLSAGTYVLTIGEGSLRISRKFQVLP